MCGVEKCVECSNAGCTECVDEYEVRRNEDEGTECVTEEEARSEKDDE